MILHHISQWKFTNITLTICISDPEMIKQPHHQYETAVDSNMASSL